ncbi:hypothetical protein [Alkalilacustris brevis]|uniref:hypothetical protein n=1 Tax=Alkalilacustris brevis TaxID=2026338 RepID=UPI000E0E0108|nr:hypothetical protein [Alkalilacustris brevis]
MHLDVLDLREFYYRTGLGRAAQRALRAQMLQIWPHAKGETVAGFGFAVPLLRPYLAGARRVIALMPGQQGVMPWPAGMPNVSVLCEETHWPLANGTIDRLVILHGLETSENHDALLEEAARVVSDTGRALFILPNRRGLWARRDGTPFGYGRPYSLGQIEGLLARHDFVPERHLAALFMPPSGRRFWLRSADWWEGIGRRLAIYGAGGVLLVEASKRNPPSLRHGVRSRARRPLRVLEGLPGGDPRPA